MLRKMDGFGQTLNLQFRGSDTFKSKLGGAVSLLIYLVVIVYAFEKCDRLFRKEDPDIVSTH